MRITIGRKIALGFTIILVLMIAMGIGAYQALNTFKETVSEVKKDFLELERIDRLRAPLLEALIINDYFVTGDIEKKGYFDILSVEVEDAIRQLEESPHLGKSEKAYIDKIKKNFAMLKIKSDEILKLANLSKKEFVGSKVNKLVEEIDAVSLFLVEDIEAFYKYIENEIAESIKYMERTKISSSYTIVIATLLSILLAILIGFVLTRGITQPVLALTTAAERVAKGDLTQEIGVKSHDELRDLSNAFDRMVRDLRESRTHLDNIIESSLDCIVVTDQRGNITRVNKSFLKLFGYKEEEVIGKHMSEFSPRKEKTYKSNTGELIEIKKVLSPNPKTLFYKLIEKGNVSNWESYFIRKDKTVLSVETNIALLYSHEGDVIGSVGIIRDITERKRVERKLMEYQNQLKSLASQLTLIEERERRRFATYLHDRIGQTLFITKIKLEMLRKSSSATDIIKSSDEILKIIEQIIKDTRSLTFELSPPILYQLGLEAALEWLIEQMKEQYGILVKFEDDKQLKLLDDDMLILLFQAVRELLINVTKHAQARKVKVSIRRTGENLRIQVEDDGVGFITSEIGSSRYKNKGFGLFSIKERLDHLGGNLGIESKPNQGTRITLMAPLKSKKENYRGKTPSQNSGMMEG